MSEPRNFFAELKRRNVYKVAVAYAVVAWLLIQAASIILPTYEAPAWTMKVLIAALAIGFPIAAVLAWAFEITAEGIKRAENVSPNESIKSRTGRKLIAMTIVLACIATGLLIFKLVGTARWAVRSETDDGSRGGGMASLPTSEKSIAVLPLVNQSGDPAQEYFSDGLTEELINVLGQVRELRVIGRNSSFRFKGKTENSRAIGEALRVANVLEGSVRKSGDRVRISIQLVNAATDSQRWSQTYDRELKDVFAVQEEIARSVAEQLRVTLVGDAGNGLARPSNENLDAYKAYLQAQFYFGQRNDEATTKAITLLQEALRLDPKYAEAHFLMSRALSAAASTKGVSGRAKFEQARQSAITAAALKPDLAGARAALAYFDVIIDCNLAAENELSRLPPKDPTVLAVRAITRTAAGDVEQAVALQRKVIDSDPVFAQWHINLAGNLLRLRQYDEAESALRRALELQPRAQSAHADLALLAVLRGQGDIALREAELEPVGFRRAESIALAQHTRGDRAAADGALQSFIATYGADFPFEVGIIYAARGEADKACEWLNQAYAAHEPFFFRIGVNPFLKAYHSDPRFVELCRKANLPVPK